MTAQAAQDWWWGMHPGMWGMWGVWGLAMMLGMLVFWLAIIAVVVWALRSFLPALRRRDPALDVLRARYARGEIDREEFEARRRDLEGSG